MIVPMPGVTRSLAGAVTTAAGYSQVASLLAGSASSGSSLGRVLATRSMVMCDANSAVGGGVIDFSLKLCSATTTSTSEGADSTENTDAEEAARSAIISNAIVICVALLLLLGVTCMWSHFMHTTTFMESAAIGALLPSSLFPVFVFVIPSTAAGATLLFARISDSTCVGTDVVLGLLGGAISIAPVMALLALWGLMSVSPRDGVAKWSCVRTKVHDDEHHVAHNALRNWIPATTLMAKILERGTLRRWSWIATNNTTSKSGGGHHSMQHAWVVLLDFRVLWYAALDTFGLAVLSVLGVVGGLDSSSNNGALCQTSTAAVVAVLFGQILLLGLLQPFTTLFSLVYNCVTLALTCVSVMAQLLYIVLSSNSTSGLWLVELSSGCSLAVVGVSILKMLLDVVDLAAATRRRWLWILAARDHARGLALQNVILVATDAVPNTPLTQVDDMMMKQDSISSSISFNNGVGADALLSNKGDSCFTTHSNQQETDHTAFNLLHDDTDPSSRVEQRSRAVVVDNSFGGTSTSTLAHLARLTAPPLFVRSSQFRRLSVAPNNVSNDHHGQHAFWNADGTAVETADEDVADASMVVVAEATRELNVMRQEKEKSFGEESEPDM